MSKHYLIVGGSGFIGRHIVSRALEDNCSVTVTSRRDSTMRLKQHKNLNILQVDLTSPEQVKVLSKYQFSHVINCAGYIDHTLFKNGGKNLIAQHFSGVVNLISSLDRTNLKSFIQLGSSDEYGDTKAPQSEEQRESPISPYSFGKVATTHFLQMLHQTEQFPTVVIRIFLAFGPGQDQNRFLPQIIRGCLSNATFPTSKGEQLRDFCFIDDIIRGIFLAMNSEKALGEVINLASGQGRSIRHMIETVQTIIGAGKPQFGHIPYRPGENMELFADISKAERILKWKPTVSLEEGLRKTIQSYR